MEEAVQDKGWRGSAEVWLDGAYALLVEGGVEAVKILPLAARLGLSRTSFYWHFADRDALLDGLIERWHGQNTGALIRQANAPAATMAEAMLNVIDCWILPDMFDAGLEFAMRTWAQTDAGVAARIGTEDAARIAALTALYARFGLDALEAEVRARAVYLTQIGYISMRTHETLAQRMRRFPVYCQVFGGTPPSQAEWRAFRDRHGLKD